MGEFNYFFGASYLFLLNTLFICLSTIIVVRYLKFPLRQFINPRIQKKVTWYSYISLFLVVIPSVYLFYLKVQETVFNENVKRFVSNVVLVDENLRADFSFEYNGNNSEIELILKNRVVSEDVIEVWKQQMNNFNLSPEFLMVIQGEDLETKLAEMKRDLESSAGAGGFDIIQQKQDRIELLEQELRIVQTEVELVKKRQLNITSLRRSLQLHFPEIDTFEVYAGVAAVPDQIMDSVFSIAVKYKPYIRESKRNTLNEKLYRQLIIYLEDHDLLVGSKVKVFNF
jgi:uncharacterized membrane protein